MGMSAIGDIAQLANGGLPPNVGIGFGPAPIDGGPGQMYGGPADSPIYGQQSPFQPPSPNPTQPQQNPNIGMGFGMPPDAGMFGGKSGFGGLLPFFNNPQLPSGPGQMYGGPVGQPIINPLQGSPIGGAQQGQLSRIARPGMDQQVRSPAPMTTQAQVPQSTYGRVSNNKPQQPLYRGGLRQPPNNYRPPIGRIR